MKPIINIVAAAIMLSGCASIVDGTTEEITVNTNPSGADCQLLREGMVIGEISKTPGSQVVKKTKHDMTISCSKPGYQTATYFDHSGVQGSTWGNIVLGGGIGWAVDSAAGADNHYESPVNVSMVPAENVQKQ
jgi:hypothetical protein